MKKVFSYIQAFSFLLLIPFFWHFKEKQREGADPTLFDSFLRILKEHFQGDVVPDTDDLWFFELIEKMDRDILYQRIKFKIYRKFIKYYFRSIPKFILEEWK